MSLISIHRGYVLMIESKPVIVECLIEMSGIAGSWRCSVFGVLLHFIYRKIEIV